MQGRYIRARARGSRMVPVILDVPVEHLPPNRRPIVHHFDLHGNASTMRPGMQVAPFGDNLSIAGAPFLHFQNRRTIRPPRLSPVDVLLREKLPPVFRRRWPRLLSIRWFPCRTRKRTSRIQNMHSAWPWRTNIGVKSNIGQFSPPSHEADVCALLTHLRVQ